MSPLWRIIWTIAAKSVYILAGVAGMVLLVWALAELVDWLDRNGHL